MSAPAAPSVKQESEQPAAGQPAAKQDGNQPNSSLYVGDLDRDVIESQLFEAFSAVRVRVLVCELITRDWTVASIRVCRDAVTRRSLGYAYVNFNATLDPTAAERALEALNYSPLNGRPMRIMWSHRDPAQRKSGVGNIFIKNLDKSIDNKALHGYLFCFWRYPALPARSERATDTEVKFTNVYVKNLPEEIDDDKLTAMFKEFGTVSSAVVMKDNEGKSKGFGFVNMEDADQAAKAVEELNGKEVDGKEIYVGRAQKKAEREAMLRQKFEELRVERIQKYAGLNLYVKNLHDEVDDETLRSEFAHCGTITSAKVMMDASSGRAVDLDLSASLPQRRPPRL
eukprot:jgi/Picre1/28195/NNA_003601.t1